MKRELQRSIRTLLSGSALVLASTTVSAITVSDLGRLDPARPGLLALSVAASVPQYAWDGWNNGFRLNHGWAHSVQWYTFRTASATLQITMTSAVEGMNPAFSIWRTNGTFIGGNHLSHDFNQLSHGGGISSANGFIDWLRPQPNAEPPIRDGVTRLMGYVNGGPAFTNADGVKVGAGTRDKTRRATGYSAYADIFPAGQYLIAVGGSCNNVACGVPGAKAYRLAVTVVPPSLQ